MTLTKDHLINAIAEENGFQKKRTIEIVETLLELIKSSLASGEDVLDQWLREVLCQGEARKKGQESGNRRGYDAGCKAGGDFQVFRAAAG